MIQHVLLGDLAPLCFVAGLTGPGPAAGARAPAGRAAARSSRIRSSRCRSGRSTSTSGTSRSSTRRRSTTTRSTRSSTSSSSPAARLMWSPVVETLPAPAWFGTGWKLGYIVVVRAARDDPRQRLHLVERGLLPLVRARRRRRGGSPPVHDQNLAGVVMMAEGSLVTLGDARLALPAARRGGRAAAAAARAGPRPAAGEARRPLRPGGGPQRALEAAASRRRLGGTRVGYSRVRQARQSARSGRRVAACSPSSER